jgi:hypothetical protein
LGINISKSVALLLVIIILTPSSLFVYSPVKAESQRKDVPGDYSTITAAVKNANDGDTIFVKKGIYEEATLVIDKSITLVGESATNTIISLHPPWVPTGGVDLSGPIYGYDNAIKITANNVTFSGFSIISDAPSGGVPLVTGSRIQITNNYITTGLFLESAGQNVTENIVKGGIECVGSDKIITNNVLDSIWIMAENVLVKDNTISSDYGIAIGGWENTVVRNTIKNCKVALSFWAYARDNEIYHNNFINNTKPCQTTNLYNQTVGTWDRGYAEGGNYWSDYSLKYPYAKEIDESGIGDTPYAIDQYNKDNFPLLSPINLSDPPLKLLSQLETIPPTISIMSPEPKKYSVNTLSLTFNISELTAWIGYSIDERDNITIFGNTTLASLSDGPHNLTVCATDIYGNTGISVMVLFSVDTISPIISVLSPQNQNYTSTDVPLTFTVNEFTSQITYAVDGEYNVTIAGNTTLTGLTNGNHNLTIYAKDEIGNVGASETICFSIDVKEDSAEPFAIMPVAIVTATSLAVISVALLVYFKKRKH